MKKEIKHARQMLGIMDAVITHQVEKTEANIRWDGPKITPAQWHQMLAFFKWTQDTAKSESQVKLFVSKDCWAIWAFPQKSHDGMHSEELDTPEAKEQREMFKQPDGWHYFGTVHHHCSSAAFQSGTDERNEDTIDGLHITVGHLESPHYSIHARFMLEGLKYQANLSWFWDIGEEITGLLPKELHNRAAEHQMGIPAPKDTEFPEQWKKNYIDTRPVVVETKAAATNPGFPHGHWSESDFSNGWKAKLGEDAGCNLSQWILGKLKRVRNKVEDDMIIRDLIGEEWYDIVLDCDTYDHIIMDIIKALSEEDVTWDELIVYAEHHAKLAAEKEGKELEAEVAEAQAERAETEMDQVAADIKDSLERQAAEGSPYGGAS